MPIVDISKKDVIVREAIAEGFIRLKRDTIETIKKGSVKKGDPLETAKVSAALAVKNTPQVIPYCHPIPIEHIDISFEILDDGIKALCKVKATSKTGVEMEALVGVTIALLTIWDMIKYLEKDEKGQYPHTRIEYIKVVKKVKANAAQRT